MLVSEADFKAQSLALNTWESEALTKSREIKALDRLKFCPAPEDSSSRFRPVYDGPGDSLSLVGALFKIMRVRDKTRLRLLGASNIEDFAEKLLKFGKSSAEGAEAVSPDEVPTSSDEETSDTVDSLPEADSGTLVARFHLVFGVDVRVYPGNSVYNSPLMFGSGSSSGNPEVSVGHIYKNLYVPLGEVVNSNQAADLFNRAPLASLVERVTDIIRQSPRISPSCNQIIQQPSEPSLAEARANELTRILNIFDGIQEFDNFEQTDLKENANAEMKKKLDTDPEKYRLCLVKFTGRHNGSKIAEPVSQQSDGLKRIQLSNPGSWPPDRQVLVEVTEKIPPDQARGTVLGFYQRAMRYQFLPRDTLEKCLTEQPNKFKRCTLELNSGQGGTAVPVDVKDPITKIELNGRENCGRACQNDEVVVEVMGQDRSTKEFKGRVVGVYKQAEKLRYQLFLCEVLPNPGSLMRPLCGTFPKIGYDNTYAHKQQHCRESDRLEGHQNRVESGQVSANLNREDIERINRDYVSVYAPKNSSNGKVYFEPKYTQRVNKEFCEKVFLVCYEFWHLDKNYPLGKVVHVIENSGTDQAEVFDLIQMRHRLPRPLRETAEVRQQVANISKQAKQPRVKGRVDYRSVRTVTIDNPETRDMDDAISYSRDPKTGEETVGVHITDVTEYLPLDSRIDKLARNRLRTIYPPKSSAQHVTPNHMLPRSLAENTLSLKEGEDRHCLSVIFKFKRDHRSNSNLTWGNPEFQQTVIRSDLRLNKSDVQPVLLETERDPTTFGRTSEPFVHMLRALWEIAKRLRLKRLDEAGFQVQNEECDDDGEGIGKTFETSCLVEELMVLANLSVGQWLADCNQPVVARVQDKPRPAAVEQWLKMYEMVLVHMPRLQRDLRALNRSFAISDFPLSVSKSDYQFINQFYRGKTRDCVLRLMSDSRHPHMMLALTEWFSVCQVACYVPTQLITDGVSRTEERPPPPYHFSLQQTNYVHFTSPMRRYADIIVHRAFRAELNGRVESAKGLDELCDYMRTLDRRARHFSKDSASYEFASRLKRQPQQKLVVVKSIDEAQVAFTNVQLRELPKSIGVLKMSSFGLSARPVAQDTNKFRFRWSRRIFVHPSCDDLETKQYFTHIQRKHGSEVRVCRDTYVQRVKCEPVRQLRKRFIESGADYSSVRSNFQQLDQVLLADKGTWMVTCESDETTNQLLVAGNAVQFYREVSIGDIIRVQFRAQLRHGLLTPAVSLVEICGSHSVCVSHKEDPVRCFAEVTDTKSKSTYSNIREYAEIWQRIVAIESATIASRADDSVVIHEVSLEWTYHRPSNRWLGAFHLPLDFCVQRQIKVGSDATVIDPQLENKMQELYRQQGRGGGRSLSGDALNEAFNLAGDRSRFSDFLCLRFRRDGTETGREGHTVVAHGGILLVYHTVHGRNPKCHFKSSGVESANCQLVVFALQQHDQTSRFEWTEVNVATVEVLQKFLPIRRQELALWKLPRMPPDSLAHKVSLLGTREESTEDISYGQKLKEKRVESYSIATGVEERYSDHTDEDHRFRKWIPCNSVQQEAITKAMKYDLTLIWGPPGTGKTSTGVMLTYWFVFVNRCFDEFVDKKQPEQSEDGDDDDDGEEELVEDDGVERAPIDFAAFAPSHGSSDLVRMDDALSPGDADDSNSWSQVGPNGRPVKAETPRTAMPKASESCGGSCDGASARKFRRRGFNLEHLNVKDDEMQKRRQVLYCGPSNRSVDVVAEYLQSKLDKKCPKIVRVFSEQMEQQKYPVPGDGAHNSRMSQDTEPTPTMEEIALHNLIRNPEYNPRWAQLLRAFDMLFAWFLAQEFKTDKVWRQGIQETAAADPTFHKFLELLALQILRQKEKAERGKAGVVHSIDLDLVLLTTMYKRMVAASKKLVLQFFEVILCTTSVSCSGVLQSACKFTQIIIDEAGMCTEPETLVPLVGFLNTEEAKQVGNPASYFAERLVLIGDHKQLRPIIENRTAEQLGLGTSLFERHSHRAVMLSYQYRMHPSLAEFSADYFYRTSRAHLQTRESPAWTGLQKREDLFLNESLPWNGINTHILAKNHVYDSYNESKGSHVRGKLKTENANVLIGCWPGKRCRNDYAPPSSNRSVVVYSSERRVTPMDLHPKGEEDRIVFLHVEGCEEKVTVSTEEGSEDSRKNEAEISQVLRVYEAIREKAERPRIFGESLAVLSQYRYQVSSIAERIKSKLRVKSPIVKTVIASQGSEFDYVILSLVRSLPEYEIPNFPLPSWEAKYLGFITDANQINVALTRARKGLIIIGNQNLLKANLMWRELLNHLRRGNCIVDSPDMFPGSTGDKRYATRDGEKPKSDGFRMTNGRGYRGAWNTQQQPHQQQMPQLYNAGYHQQQPHQQHHQQQHHQKQHHQQQHHQHHQHHQQEPHQQHNQQQHHQQHHQQQHYQQQQHHQQYQQKQWQQRPNKLPMRGQQPVNYGRPQQHWQQQPEQLGFVRGPNDFPDLPSTGAGGKPE